MSSTDRPHLVAALESLEQEERQLVAELEATQVRLAQLRDVIAPMKKLLNGSALRPPRLIRLRIGPEGYEGLTISQAIHKVLKQGGKAMTAPEIKDALLGGGYKTDSMNLTNLIGATVRRLEGKRFQREGDLAWSALDGDED
jgi:hypothetical protein